MKAFPFFKENSKANQNFISVSLGNEVLWNAVRYAYVIFVATHGDAEREEEREEALQTARKALLHVIRRENPFA